MTDLLRSHHRRLRLRNQQLGAINCLVRRWRLLARQSSAATLLSRAGNAFIHGRYPQRSNWLAETSADTVADANDGLMPWQWLKSQLFVGVDRRRSGRRGTDMIAWSKPAPNRMYGGSKASTCSSRRRNWAASTTCNPAIRSSIHPRSLWHNLVPRGPLATMQPDSGESTADDGRDTSC